MIGAYITEVRTYSVDCDECDWGEAGHNYFDARFIADGHNYHYHGRVDPEPTSEPD